MSKINVGARFETLTFCQTLPFNVNKRLECATDLIKKYNNVEYICPDLTSFYYVDNVLESV